MKQLFFILLSIVIVSQGIAQSEKFTKAMTSTISTFDSAKTADDMLAASAAFERIADAEKTQWLPYYYASLSQILFGFIKNDMSQADAYATKANDLLKKADALQPKNSEISCIKSLIATLHMLVDPQNRWQVYGPVIQTELDNAKKQDPTNPRPYYLQGQNLRNTPEQFGGGCATAKPVLEEALKKYETFKPASNIDPSWGKGQVEKTLATCQ